MVSIRGSQKQSSVSKFLHRVSLADTRLPAPVVGDRECGGVGGGLNIDPNEAEASAGDHKICVLTVYEQMTKMQQQT